ncbi:uncharacterized protein BJ171DRAFT_596108 [Polychytrium aggregatum]|uniref:uncharacterized protein n=1 Tax=Polychytrium aggregatum TaxID=110093 RepID=UPI0022FE45EB|nr:uncharacterized protein BJ171DRAFT_596108 [Polychytrium aggregatum]KAI9208328.1 hypothetical protein BJ171DRAFT_596108 [Polychytrium aggregatum]
MENTAFNLVFLLTTDNRVIETLLGLGFVFDAVQNLGPVELAFALAATHAGCYSSVPSSSPWNNPTTQNVFYYTLLPFESLVFYWICVALPVWFVANVVILLAQIRQPAGISSQKILTVTRYQIGGLSTLLFFPIMEHLLRPTSLIVDWAFYSSSYFMSPDIAATFNVLSAYNLFVLVLSIICLILFLVPLLAMTGLVFSAESNPSRRLGARNAPRIDFTELLLRTMISIAFSVLKGSWAAVVLWLANTSILLLTLYYPPYFSLVSNQAKAFVVAFQTFAATASLLVAWQAAEVWGGGIYIVIALLPVFGAIGVALLRYRLYHLLPRKLDRLMPHLADMMDEKQICAHELRKVVRSYWTPCELDLALRTLLALVYRKVDADLSDLSLDRDIEADLDGKQAKFAPSADKPSTGIPQTKEAQLPKCPVYGSEESRHWFWAWLRCRNWIASMYPGWQATSDPQQWKSMAFALLMAGTRKFENSSWLQTRVALFLTFEGHDVSNFVRTPPTYQAKEIAKETLLMRPKIDSRYSLYFLFKKCSYDFPTREEITEIFDQAALIEEEGITDVVQAVQYRHDFTAAKEHEKDAVKHAVLFWKNVARQNRNYLLLLQIADRVENHETLARSYYLKLMGAFPQSSKIVRSYANFLRVVSNDTEMAQRADQQADFIEASSSKKRNKSKKLAGSTSAAEFELASTGSGRTSQSSLPQIGLHERQDFDFLGHAFDSKAQTTRIDQLVAKVQRGLKISIFTSTATMFICIIVLFSAGPAYLIDNVQAQQSMFLTGMKIRSLSQFAVYYVRELEWAYSHPSSVPDTVSVAKQNVALVASQIQASFTAFYTDNLLTSSTVVDAWNDPSYSIQIYGHSSSGAIENTTMYWDMAHIMPEYISCLIDVNTTGVLPLENETSWIFVIDNGVGSGFTGILDTVSAYQAALMSTNDSMRMIMFAVFATTCVVLPLGLALLLYIPSYIKVRNDFSESVELFFDIPVRHVSELLDRIDSKKSDVGAAEEQTTQSPSPLKVEGAKSGASKDKPAPLGDRVPHDLNTPSDHPHSAPSSENVLTRQTKTKEIATNRDRVRASSPKLRKVTILYAVSLTLMLVCSTFALCWLWVTNNTLVERTIEVEQAGARRAWVWRILALSQELMRNDTTLARPEWFRNELRAAADTLYWTNAGFKSGNVTLNPGLLGVKGRLSALDQVEYQFQCLGPADQCGSSDYLIEKMVSLGKLVASEASRSNGVSEDLPQSYLNLRDVMVGPGAILLDNLNLSVDILANDALPLIQAVHTICICIIAICAFIFLMLVLYLLPVYLRDLENSSKRARFLDLEESGYDSRSRLEISKPEPEVDASLKGKGQGGIGVIRSASLESHETIHHHIHEDASAARPPDEIWEGVDRVAVIGEPSTPRPDITAEHSPFEDTARTHKVQKTLSFRRISETKTSPVDQISPLEVESGSESDQ